MKGFRAMKDQVYWRWDVHLVGKTNGVIRTRRETRCSGLIPVVLYQVDIRLFTLTIISLGYPGNKWNRHIRVVGWQEEEEELLLLSIHRILRDFLTSYHPTIWLEIIQRRQELTRRASSLLRHGMRRAILTSDLWRWRLTGLVFWQSKIPCSWVQHNCTNG